MASSKYIKEVEETLHRLSTGTPSDFAAMQRYIGTKLPVLGLSSDVQKQVCKNGFSFYSEDKTSVFRIFDGIYKAGKSMEVKSQAFIYLDQHYKHIPVDVQLELLPHWVKQVDNWAHSDYLSKFLTRLVEHEATEKAMLDIIRDWNRSAVSWERRQSLVSLFYYARTKGRHVSFDTCIRLLKPLLKDPEYFVQKAVGWTLRECYVVYPEKTYAFMEEQYRHISSIAFTAAIEKMSTAEKDHLKLLRKKNRA